MPNKKLKQTKTLTTSTMINHVVLKNIATRMMESAIIGGILLYGVVQVMNTKVDYIINNQNSIALELKVTAKEQARRLVMVESSFSKAHTHEHK